MKTYKEVTCSTAQKRWLMRHLRQLLHIYDELIRDMRKRYVDIIQEKGYLRAEREDRGRYLENRRLRKEGHHGYRPAASCMVSIPF